MGLTGKRILDLLLTLPMLLVQVLNLLNLPDDVMAVFTSSPVEARIHVGFMGKDLLPETLTEKIRDGPWTHVVGFRPTGMSPLLINTSLILARKASA